MSKSTRIIKRFLALFLVVLLSCEGFAAAVSDNDGSAFITKAEFDSLKNNFQSQINLYNTSIDNKIDSAIAGYLSGIKVETTEELDSYLNKINGLAEDFYLDGSGNKVKYGYRCMARTFNVPVTQKPIGAKTFFFMSRNDNDMDFRYRYGWARFGLTYNTRTGLGEVKIPEDTYQIGKYFEIDETSNGYIYSNNKLDEYEYYFYTGGSSFTYNVDNGITEDTNAHGTLTVDGPFKNEDENWGLKTGQASYVWDHQCDDHSYDTWRCLYGTSFKLTDSDMLFPHCGVTNDSIYALRKKNRTKMTIQDNSYVWNLYYTERGVYWGQNADILKRWDKAANRSRGDDKMTTDNTFPWTFYMNCHPYEQINTKNLIDQTASQVLGEKVLITDGIPVFKASFDGIVDMKIKLHRTAGHRIGFGLKKERFKNTYYGYNIDGALNLRDFSDTRITSNMLDTDDEIEMRMDVKKSDIIWIKIVDVDDQYGFAGVETTQIKLTSKD